MTLDSLDEYQQEALRTAGPKCRGSLAYSMGGVGGEAGEYVDVVKKHLFHDHPEAESREKAIKELGDLLWGIAQAADAWGVTLSTVATANVAKLRARYPTGFSVEASKVKADEKPISSRLCKCLVDYGTAQDFRGDTVCSSCLREQPKSAPVPSITVDLTPNPDCNAIEGAQLWSAEDARVGICAVASPGGYLCTRSPNHDGIHIAASAGPASQVLERWAKPEQIAAWTDPSVDYARVYNAPRPPVEKTMLSIVAPTRCPREYDEEFGIWCCDADAPCTAHGCEFNHCACPDEAP